MYSNCVVIPVDIDVIHRASINVRPGVIVNRCWQRSCVGDCHMGQEPGLCFYCFSTTAAAQAVTVTCTGLRPVAFGLGLDSPEFQQQLLAWRDF